MPIWFCSQLPLFTWKRACPGPVGLDHPSLPRLSIDECISLSWYMFRFLTTIKNKKKTTKENWVTLKELWGRYRRLIGLMKEWMNWFIQKYLLLTFYVQKWCQALELLKTAKLLWFVTSQHTGHRGQKMPGEADNFSPWLAQRNRHLQSHRDSHTGHLIYWVPLIRLIILCLSL